MLLKTYGPIFEDKRIPFISIGELVKEMKGHTAAIKGVSWGMTGYHSKLFKYAIALKSFST